MRPLTYAPALIAATLAVAVSAPATAAIPVGTAAPDFSTQGAIGGKAFQFSLSQALKRGPVVLYFFPKAFTSGCTIETKAFADASDEFKKAGATLIGVSADDIDTLKRFSVEGCRSKFPVAVASAQMIRDYDVKLPVVAMSNRTTFVIGRNGKVQWSLSEMRPEGHITGSLAALRQYKARPKA